MYTQCPDCATSFRVTAEVLKQAAGKVRCGGCGNAFNALAYLSESKPVAKPRDDVQEALPELKPESPVEAAEAPPSSISPEQSAALLKTLDQLAGDNVRLEDTGVEWRLLSDDEEEAEDDVEAAEVFDDAAAARTGIYDKSILSSDDELRFDDNTGLPDEFDAPSRSTPEPEATPEHQPAPEPIATAEPEDLQADLAFGEPEEWGDLLSEAVIEPEPSPESEEPPEPTLAEELAALPDDDGPLDIDTQFNLQAEAMGIDLSGIGKPDADDEPVAEEAAAEEPQEVAFTEETSIDHDLMAAAFEAERAAAEALEASNIELALDVDNAIDEIELDELIEDERVVDEVIPSPDDAAVEDEQPSFEEAAAEKPELPEHVAEAMADFPDSTGELEFELAKAQELLDEVVESSGTASDATETTGGEFEGGIDDEIQLADESIAEEIALSVEDDFAIADDVVTELSEAGAEAEPVVPPASDEEQTINMMIDEDLMRLAIEDDEGFASTMVLEGRGPRDKAGGDKVEDKVDVEVEVEGQNKDDEAAGVFDAEGAMGETIIMEGAFARTADEQQRLEADKEEVLAATRQSAQDDDNEKPSINYGAVAGIVVLLLLLAGQFAHQSRAALATIPAVNNAIAPIYRAIGMPITPEWDIAGWRFEVTKGSTGDFDDEVAAVVDDTADDAAAETGDPPADDTADGEDAAYDDGQEVLTIYSRIGNQSAQPLPYPLISVSLTDRFEEIIGSKVLEPGEYLTGDFDPRRPVPPGNTFNAVISIESPSVQATGFKLNVCYRQTGGLLRCAIEDFK